MNLNQTIEAALRAGEICALKWKDVQTAKRFLRVTGSEIGGHRGSAFP
jgi:integrase